MLLRICGLIASAIATIADVVTAAAVVVVVHRLHCRFGC